jgi:predicted benzoate:H+ symporter BenE
MKIFGTNFNKHELAGAFGDIGTDLPLIAAMIVAADMNATQVLILFGAAQILTGFYYKLPMPVQPLKAIATIVITQKVGMNILTGAGLSVGVVMLLLSLSGALDFAVRMIPKSVIRGLQAGLGLSLCSLSLREYLPSGGFEGYISALAAFVFIFVFRNRKNVPTALITFAVASLYTLLFKNKFSFGSSETPFFWQVSFPNLEAMKTGFILLALPQIPLSLGNSVVSTKQVCEDFFPERKDISVKKIGITYSLMNLAVGFLGGIPVCHGAGGLVGHYTFGGRSGGSVVIYGCFYLFSGIFFGEFFSDFVKIFPLSVLGIILLFESLALLMLLRDVASEKNDFFTAIFTAVAAFGLPYGFLFGMIFGSLLRVAIEKFETNAADCEKK